MLAFQIEDRVVHPAHGLGSVRGLVTKSFAGGQTRQYYEIAIHQGVVWVPVEASATTGLRSLTAKTDLTHYRGVLASRPAALIPDHRQRRLALQVRLKLGLFQDMCEVARDLTARSWHKTLGESDSTTLNHVCGELSQEWAAVEGVSIGDATREINALLLEGRRVYQD